MRKWVLCAALAVLLAACGAEKPHTDTAGTERAPVLGTGSGAVQEEESLEQKGASETVPESASETGRGAELAEVPSAAEEIDPVLELLAGMTVEQKVGQLFFARCPEEGTAEQIARFQPGGLLLFGRDFQGQTVESMREIIAGYQAAAKIPLLIGVDEEGGTVARASGQGKPRPERFRSPRAVFAAGGWEEITRDTAEKDAFLLGMGVNVNFAPVADVSADPADFIYQRAFGQGAAETAEYAAAVVRQMKTDQIGSVLKHFPGYGSNADTHTGTAADRRTLREFRERDFLPFAAGISAGADAVLVSHTVVESMDAAFPASLSLTVHKFLRGELRFSGAALTDDLAMEALGGYGSVGEIAVLAVNAGNDLLLSSDLPAQYGAVLSAVQSGEITPARLEEAVGRVLRWKAALGLLGTAGAEE